MSYVELFSKTTPNKSLLGGKGSNLIKLFNLGIKTPLGFIVNTNSYTKFLKESHLKDELDLLLKKTYAPNEVLELSNKINDFFIDSEVPKVITEEIKRVFSQHNEQFGERVSFAVRSSANIEDSKDFSFAGQAESYLCNKTFNEIILSMKKCWASLFSPQALLYFLQMRRSGKKVNLKDLKMAVIVQKMVNPQVSGVLFTSNVINNDLNQMLINSTWGLGETITNNTVIPDLIILKKEKFEVLKIELGDKQKMLIPNPEGSFTLLVETDPESKRICSLNDHQLLQLHKIGSILEKMFEYPQDIEWAIENDEIYILQSRPITTLKN